MKRMLFKAVSVFVLGSFLAVAGPAVLSGVDDPCAILSKSDIEAAVGRPVSEGKTEPGATPAAGTSCSYNIPPYGTLNILIKPLSSIETPEKIKSAFSKRKTKFEEAPEIGNHAFYIYPGYGMIQLNAFKGSNYILITILIPEADEAAAKTAAGKLMVMLLEKLK